MHPTSLCASCKHRRDIQSKRGSVFWLCGKSKTDPRFPKYPPQPVGRCPGWEKVTPEAAN
jgi:hypothetical protein